MVEKKTLSDRIDNLTDRIDDLEEHLYSKSHDAPRPPRDVDERFHYCGVKPSPPRQFGPEVSPNRAAAILAVGNKWVNRTNLHYYFFESGPSSGDNAQREVVRKAFQVWKNVGIGLTFTEIPEISEAEVRIGFLRGDGSWSGVGTRDPTVRTERANNELRLGHQR